MIAKRVNNIRGGVAGAECFLHFLPHRKIRAVINVVAGLQTKINCFILQNAAEVLHDCERTGIFGFVSAHLGVTHNEERSLSAVGRRAKCTGFRPLCTVAYLKFVGSFGCQTGNGHGVDTRTVFCRAE